MDKTCKIDGCNGRHKAHGYCDLHYRRFFKHGDPLFVKNRITKEKISKMPEYDVWCAMRFRCQNPNDAGYKNYGGRGIKVCDRWKEKYFGFDNFIKDMGRRPSPKHSIDRIDNNGDYCPENCRWATRHCQIRNRRNTHWYEYRGEKKLLHEWSEELGISYGTLSDRARKGWRGDKLFFKGKYPNSGAP